MKWKPVQNLKTLRFFVPAAFKPDNDRLNDNFNFIANPGVNIVYFRVYNRWGQLIYTNTQNKLGRDGFCKGIRQPIGVYPWTLQGTDELGKIINLKGTVTLIR